MNGFYEFFTKIGLNFILILYRALSPNLTVAKDHKEDLDTFISKMRARLDQWKSFIESM